MDAQLGGAGSDTFVLRADNTSSATEILSLAGDADLLLDFQPGVDRIGLTDGLTEADLIIADLGTLPVTIPPEVQGLIDEGIISATDIDPDGDGLARLTSISASGGDFLGVVLNVTPADLQGQFVSV